jgi:hypothetical protein
MQRPTPAEAIKLTFQQPFAEASSTSNGSVPPQGQTASS